MDLRGLCLICTTAETVRVLRFKERGLAKELKNIINFFSERKFCDCHYILRHGQQLTHIFLHIRSAIALWTSFGSGTV